MEHQYIASEINVGVADINDSYATLYLTTDYYRTLSALNNLYGVGEWGNEEFYEVDMLGNRIMKSVISTYSEKTGQFVKHTGFAKPAPWAEEKEILVMEHDALFHAALSAGIGRELYTFQNIHVSLKDENNKDNIKISEYLMTYTDRSGNSITEKRYRTYDKLSVEQLKYNETGDIVALAIRNDTLNKRIFVENREQPTNPKATITPLSTAEDNRLENALKVKVGVGSKKNAVLGELNEQELWWVYSNTQDPNVKRSCMTIAKAKEACALIFTSHGIAV